MKQDAFEWKSNEIKLDKKKFKTIVTTEKCAVDFEIIQKRAFIERKKDYKIFGKNKSHINIQMQAKQNVKNEAKNDTCLISFFHFSLTRKNQMILIFTKCKNYFFLR